MTQDRHRKAWSSRGSAADDLAEGYGQGLVPLIVPLTLRKHHLNRYPVPEWVHQQAYLNPDPKELMLRSYMQAAVHSGPPLTSHRFGGRGLDHALDPTSLVWAHLLKSHANHSPLSRDADAGLELRTTVKCLDCSAHSLPGQDLRVRF